MNEVVLPVSFDFHAPARIDPIQIDGPLPVMRRLLKRGIQYLELIGLTSGLEGIASRNLHGAHVPVEEDVDFILQHYEDIESIFREQAYRDIFLFLNDGALELNSRFDRDMVDIQVVTRPGLRSSDKPPEILRVSQSGYLNGWRRAARDIVSAANLDGS